MHTHGHTQRHTHTHSQCAFPAFVHHQALLYIVMNVCASCRFENININPRVTVALQSMTHFPVCHRYSVCVTFPFFWSCCKRYPCVLFVAQQDSVVPDMRRRSASENSLCGSPARQNAQLKCLKLWSRTCLATHRCVS